MQQKSIGKIGLLLSLVVASGFLVIILYSCLTMHALFIMPGIIAQQVIVGVICAVTTVAAALAIVLGLIQKLYGETASSAQKHQLVFQRATEKLYENIYEIDVTHNRAASEETESYFESLGVPHNTPYDLALPIIARQQIKEEFRQGYLNTFSPENVLRAYHSGEQSLKYDFMISTDGGKNFYWMRIIARIFYWDDDESIRMFIYRQNIDTQKQQEERILEQLNRDSLSGLYNKAATQNLIRRCLTEEPGRLYAFFMLDIDFFKKVNDTWGHTMGDLVIEDFAGLLRRQFRDSDIVGRIGGDEFVVFIAAPSRAWVEEKAKSLLEILRYDFKNEGKQCHISTSIGIALSPEAGDDFDSLYQNADFALYQVKKHGKDDYTIFRPV
ncbi:GGDEF domain-containing protein [Agathobaculum sp. NTUH-O15-33]|uniref:GGDEF domain-containing protein n=1 Tax=Agathobaculum sp. NTUH-O15-33 TaxID=3079302 RepID=UPI002958D960|nr:GGDEF domain-containing protein [Agathobaculum sp. NTUH-O15-33]WNX84606.1 GGDEF domain-containing protein [Agathobaculum sp. NTUH-O15-33]